MLRTLFVGAAVVVLGAAPTAARQASGSVTSGQKTDAAPVVVARSAQYPLTSKINGRDYRIMVSTPFMFDPAVAYPVVYVLDANVFFGTVTDAMHGMSFLRKVVPAIVVGVAYPTDDLGGTGVRERRLDLTPTPSPKPSDAGPTGGGDAFLRVIEEEIKPLVRLRFKVNDAQADAIRNVLRRIGRASQPVPQSNGLLAYIVASPSIWWDNKAVLADEATFSRNACNRVSCS